MNLKYAVFASALAASGIGLVPACGTSQPPPATPTGVTNVQPVDASQAVDQITDARCKHAQVCNEIGGDRSYATMDSCMSKNRGELQDDLRASNCPRGVDDSRLSSCVAAIKTESCTGIGSGASRAMACRTGALCP